MNAQAASLGHSARVISLVGVAHLMSHVYQLALPPLFPLLARDFEVSYTALGLLVSVFSVAAVLGQVPMGFVVDRIGGGKVLIAGLLVQAAAIAAIAAVPGYWVLLLVVAVAGLAHSVYHPADYAILSRAVPEGRLGRAYTFHSFSGNIGTAAAPMVMVGLAAFWDWRGACLLIGLAGIAVALALVPFGGLLRGEVRGESEPSPSAGVGHATGLRAGMALLLSAPILLCFLFFVILNTAFVGVRVFAPSALVEMYDVPLATANGALTGFIVGAAVGVLAGGVIADRLGARSITAVIGLIGAGTLLILFGQVSLPVAAVVAVLTLTGFLRGIVQGTRDLMVYAATPAGAHGKVFAFVSTGGHVGTAIMPLVFGWILDAGEPQLTFLIAGVLALLALATFATVRRRVTG